MLTDTMLEFRRRGHTEEEMRVEALGHRQRRDPVRKQRQQIDGRDQIMLAQNIREADFAFIKGLALRIQRHGPVRGHQRRRSARTRKEDSAFLKRLADTADANGNRIEIKTATIHNECGIGGDFPVVRVHAAAGKHQRAGAELDLTIPLHHEDFHAAGGFPQQ